MKHHAAAEDEEERKSMGRREKVQRRISREESRAMQKCVSVRRALANGTNTMASHNFSFHAVLFSLH